MMTTLATGPSTRDDSLQRPDGLQRTYITGRSPRGLLISGFVDLPRVYAYRFRDIDQRSRDDAWKVIAPFIFDLMGKPERILDPAAGRGEFIGNISSPVRWAVDLVDHGITSMTGIEAHISAIENADLPEDFFDGIFASNLLEHLASRQAVFEFLTQMRLLLRQGGRIAVMGPNFRYATREYFDCADHVLPLSHIAIEEHLYSAGYTIERVIPRFLPYSFRSRLPHTPPIVRAYLHFPWAWRFLGKQFLLIARADGPDETS